MQKGKTKNLTNALLIVSFGIADVFKFELAQALSKLLLGQWKLCKGKSEDIGKLGIALFLGAVAAECFPIISIWERVPHINLRYHW